MMMAIIIQKYLIYVDDYLGYSNTNKYEYLILQRCRKMKRIATRFLANYDVINAKTPHKKIIQWAVVIRTRKQYKVK